MRSSSLPAQASPRVLTVWDREGGGAAWLWCAAMSTWSQHKRTFRFASTLFAGRPVAGCSPSHFLSPLHQVPPPHPFSLPSPLPWVVLMPRAFRLESWTASAPLVTKRRLSPQTTLPSTWEYRLCPTYLRPLQTPQCPEY